MTPGERNIDANYVSFGRQVAMDFGVSLQCMATNRSLLPYVDEMCGATASNAHFARFSAVGMNGTTTVRCSSPISSQALRASSSPS